MSKTWNWHLYDVPDDRLFIMALHDLFPRNSILVMDFVAMPRFLVSQSKALGLGVSEDRARLTMPLTRAGLRRLFGPGAKPLWLMHVHVIRRDKTYRMTGYDLGTDDGFMVTQTVPEDKIKQFCTKVSCKYEKASEPL